MVIGLRRAVAASMAFAFACGSSAASAQTTTLYNYDALGRLSESQATTGVVSQYVYDPAGNRTSKTSRRHLSYGPGIGTVYIQGFTSGVDHVDLSTFYFGITASQFLAQGVNVDLPGTQDDYCYFYLTNAGGVDNYIVLLGRPCPTLQASDFYMENEVLRPGSGTRYVFNFQSGVDYVDVSYFHLNGTAAQLLATAVNVDNAGTANDYCYIYLGSGGGVANYIVFMGLLSNQIQPTDLRL